MDTLDLVQLHCPPPAIYRDDRVFDVLDALAAEKKIAAWGVSVETCEEAMISLEREHLASPSHAWAARSARTPCPP